VCVCVCSLLLLPSSDPAANVPDSQQTLALQVILLSSLRIFSHTQICFQTNCLPVKNWQISRHVLSSDLLLTS